MDRIDEARDTSGARVAARRLLALDPTNERWQGWAERIEEL